MVFFEVKVPAPVQCSKKPKERGTKESITKKIVYSKERKKPRKCRFIQSVGIVQPQLLRKITFIPHPKHPRTFSSRSEYPVDLPEFSSARVVIRRSSKIFKISRFSAKYSLFSRRSQKQGLRRITIGRNPRRKNPQQSKYNNDPSSCLDLISCWVDFLCVSIDIKLKKISLPHLKIINSRQK